MCAPRGLCRMNCMSAQEVDLEEGALNIYFGNSGQVAAVYQVYSADGQSGPWTYTVAPDTAALRSLEFKVKRPDRIRSLGLRSEWFPPRLQGKHSRMAVQTSPAASPTIFKVTALSWGFTITREFACEVKVSEHYTHQTINLRLEPNGERSEFWSLDRSYGWYDLTITTSSDSRFRHRLAGHLETGRDSMSDPAIGTVHQPDQADLNQMTTSPV